MPLIEGFKVENYRVLRQVTLGRLRNQEEREPLTPLVAVIGKNGVGKSTLFDAFGFLADCLVVGVEGACELRQRGGFKRLVSAGSTGPIRFEVHYRESSSERPITYELSIALDRLGRPYVHEERLMQKRLGQQSGPPHAFFMLREGKGYAWTGEDGYGPGDAVALQEGSEDPQRVPVEVADSSWLGIDALGALKAHPRIVRFRNFLQHWYLSYFAPDAARSLPMAGPQRHLNVHGDNLGNVVQYMEREYRERFESILQRIAGKIPGIDRIETKTTEDGRILLRFGDKGFLDPFYAQQMSDGTLRLFAYYLLLEDPKPAPFICIDEPERDLYHKLLPDLVREFRAYATGGPSAPQIFITTHQPYLVDALAPEETWILEKGADGFSSIRRAGDDPVVKSMVEEGLPLGGLWHGDYLDPR